MNKNIIKLKNIEKWFGRVHALKGVDFEVNRGEVIGLAGENGAGKSSLIKIISGLFPPDKGDIYWKNEKIKISSVRKARKLGIETVHQSSLTIDSLDVSENIFLDREIHKKFGPIKIINKKRENEKTIKLVSELGLSIKSPKQELRICSGGEKQGIEVARAIEFNAELLILDESTVGLTLEGIDQLKKFVTKVTKLGVGCIFITHNFRHILDIADRFVFMARGKVVNEIVNENLDIKKIEMMILK